MASTLTWLDYSEHERRKMLDVIDLFREKDTRDELGIGSVRDAFADLFFPGTSTIQTRARYFHFPPRIYLDLEAYGEKARLFELLLTIGRGGWNSRCETRCRGECWIKWESAKKHRCNADVDQSWRDYSRERCGV